jgi:hypothetical protein
MVRKRKVDELTNKDNNTHIDDDDSSNDSDYNPNEDPDRSVDGDDDNDLKTSTIQTISTKRKREAELIWNEMNQLDEQETKEKMKNSLHQLGVDSKKSLHCRKKVFASSRFKAMLQLIFGGNQNDIKTASKESDAYHCESMSMSVKAAIEEAVAKVSKKVKTTEVKKFAGKEIMYVRVFVTAVDSAKREGMIVMIT